MMHGQQSVKISAGNFRSIQLRRRNFFVCSKDTPLAALRNEPEIDMAVNPPLRYMTCAEVSECGERVESRLAACADGVGGQGTLDAAGTLLKGGERFVEI